ncbi:DUF11 domain-containing protein [Spirosoma sp. HMF4905]|uniref:DUF11 domain-containing protein n=1 Tax=Spirosoma arboris TaxID=2682092 RepID=A0A7K1SPV2_9BACT|nr:sialate O-acetylesterase [Spirosoma arboris]MVM35713.1 DUF11 domain-containing protein [Spirosoma arboris]
MNVKSNVVVFVTLFSLLLGLGQAEAQIKITFPVSRLVFQRDNNNQATVQIAGSYSQTLDAVEVRAVARSAGQGTTTDWTTLQTNPTNGQFMGTLPVKGGWYKLLVRGRSGGAIVVNDSLDRFGVGEVFAIMGHSNAQGSGCTVNGVNQCPSINGANDDRVTVVSLDQNGSNFQQYLTTADTRYLPGLAFSQLLINSGFSPFASIPWLWGHMGDVLVQRINVPIMLYNAGFGGTTMQQTYWAAYNIPFQHSFVRYDLRMPYANLRNLMNLYVPTTGLRAVLVQHGENDRDNPTDSTSKYYYKVIDKVRAEFNKPNLACIVALSSFVGARFDNVRAAQFQVINTPGYFAFQGPDLDNINTQADRPDGIHFSPSGQNKAGDSWANAITDSYLSTISPYSAESQPVATIACATSNQLKLTQPDGYQYTWSTGSTSNSLTVGDGIYTARLLNGQNKVYFPPAVVVPANVQPTTPTITSDNGTLTICRSTGLKLTSSYTGPNRWSTSATSPSVVASTPGVYSVQARNAVYGCLSNAASQTISLASADLDLAIQTSRRTVALNDTLSLWFIVQNRGVCDAGSVSIQTRLPPNLSFVSSTDNLSASSNVVGGTISNITAGLTTGRRYVARLTAPGTYIAAAEIIDSTNPIMGVTLNNGTANGEKDEAQIDLRTTESSSTIYVSPNPKQGPLPSVQSSQPTPDPTKVDLSLLMQASSQSIKVGQPVSITLIVTNQGGLAATNVVLNNLLPSGLQFVSSSSGMTVNGSVVKGTISQIPVGQSVSLTFVVQATSNGVFTNQAQIMTIDQTDADSIPGNGYTNGEDDQASNYLRTAG